jgi:hypothetical protein
VRRARGFIAGPRRQGGGARQEDPEFRKDRKAAIYAIMATKESVDE